MNTPSLDYVKLVSPPGKWVVTGTKEEAKARYLNRVFTVSTNQHVSFEVTVKGIVIYGGVILCLCQVEEKYQKLYGKEPLTFYAGRLIDKHNR